MHMDKESPMKLPELTSLQYLVVHLLFTGEKTGTELRKTLRKLGVQRSPGAFSRLMGRLAMGACVKARYAQKIRGGRAQRECRFAATDYGVLQWMAAREFYASLAPPRRGFVPVSTEKGEPARRPPGVRQGTIRRRVSKQLPKVSGRHVGKRKNQ
jgi:hypothetical protein